MRSSQVESLLKLVKNPNVDKEVVRKLLTRVKVDKNTGCWLVGDWSNYCYVKVNGKSMPGHRFSHWAFKCKVPENLMACHKCDRRGCVCPGHIFVGTASDNQKDATLKSRNVWRRQTTIASIKAGRNIQNLYPKVWR